MTTKVPQQPSTAGLDEPLLGNYFVATYPPFSCWSRDGVAQVQRTLATRPAVVAPLGLYVHVPFCAHRCHFCYYHSYACMPREETDLYVDTLVRELAIYAQTPALAGRSLAFAYFGGGTPSILSPEQIHRCLRGLQGSIPWNSVEEITFECAPQSTSESRLHVLRDCGVSRISLGVQQLNDVVLQNSGRIHRVNDVERAYAAIRRVGFDVVNIDLMVGMVGETDESFADSLEHAIRMQPDSITIYQMEIPPNTPLYRASLDNQLSAPIDPWEVKRARLARGFARLDEAGYALRSAYAAVRDPSRHRFVYQESQYRGADLLGIGLASFSYVNGLHYQNLSSLPAYVESVSEGRLPVDRIYALSDEERMIREFVLQLKLGRVEAAYFREKFGVEILRRFAEPLSQFVALGLLVIDGDAVEPTRAGLLRVDRMLSAFYLAEHRNARYW